VGTAHAQLMALVQEALFDTRKSFGMFGQIHISIAGLTSEWLEVEKHQPALKHSPCVETGSPHRGSEDAS
jgi:hypothetical protein